MYVRVKAENNVEFYLAPLYSPEIGSLTEPGARQWAPVILVLPFPKGIATQVHVTMPTFHVVIGDLN